jgi:hypothetical protein
MKTKVSFAALALAAGLNIAAMGVMTPVKAASTTVDLYPHGPWKSFVGKIAGSYACGIRTEMKDGGGLAIVATGSGIDFVAFDPNWRLDLGHSYALAIEVPGETYRGAVVAVDRDTVVGKGLSLDLIERLYDEDVAMVRFGNFNWRLDLHGTSETIEEMAACARAVASR